MNKILAALRALTPQQKALLKEKWLSGSFTPQAAITLLTPVSEFDQMSDGGRKRIGCWSAALFAISIIGLVSTNDGALPWFIGVPLTLGLLSLLGVAVFFVVMVVKLSKNNLSNNFSQIALPFFAILREDMESGEPMTLKLDLSLPTDKAKETSKSSPYALGAYHKVIDTCYRDAWFAGSARLADGSTLSWSVVEEITSSKRTKRNASGKYKFKTKYHKICHLKIDVALPCKHYSVDHGAQAEDVKLKVRDGEKRTTLQLTHTIKLKANEPFDVKELIDLVAEAFRRAKPVIAGGAT